jgi:hypothetical protein
VAGLFRLNADDKKMSLDMQVGVTGELVRVARDVVFGGNGIRVAEVVLRPLTLAIWLLGLAATREAVS